MSAVKSKASLTDNKLSMLGISVYYLQNLFMKEVEEAGLSRTSKIHQIEDLNELDKDVAILDSIKQHHTITILVKSTLLFNTWLLNLEYG